MNEKFNEIKVKNLDEFKGQRFKKFWLKITAGQTVLVP